MITAYSGPFWALVLKSEARLWFPSSGKERQLVEERLQCRGVELMIDRRLQCFSKKIWTVAPIKRWDTVLEPISFGSSHGQLFLLNCRGRATQRHGHS